MENLTVYLQLDGIKAERIDAEGNLLRSKLPEITRGMASRMTSGVKQPFSVHIAQSLSSNSEGLQVFGRPILISEFIFIVLSKIKFQNKKAQTSLETGRLRAVPPVFAPRRALLYPISGINRSGLLLFTPTAPRRLRWLLIRTRTNRPLSEIILYLLLRFTAFSYLYILSISLNMHFVKSFLRFYGKFIVC